MGVSVNNKHQKEKTKSKLLEQDYCLRLVNYNTVLLMNLSCCLSVQQLLVQQNIQLQCTNHCITSKTLSRPFELYYNPITQCVDKLDSVDKITKIIEGLQQQLVMVTSALQRLS